MSDPLRLAHHHPGRLRVRAQAFRGPDAAALVDRIREALAGRTGVSRVVHTAFTGSLLVEYEPGVLEPDELCQLIAKVAGLDGVVEETLLGPGQDPARAIIRGVSTANRLTRELTSGATDLRMFAPAALAGAAVLSFVMRPMLPRWDSLLYWSYSVFRDLHQREMAEAHEAESDGSAPRP